ncbi:MAG TPA: hypothetical protein VFW89_01100 [Gemmatimonadaceae bacterium]|nr:hypothetical protein [Gemmatimonadaceae bacterium]
MRTQPTWRITLGGAATCAALLAACASAPHATRATARRFEGCVQYNKYQYSATDPNLLRVGLGRHTLVPASTVDTLDLQSFVGHRVILTADVRAGTDTIQVTQIEAVPGRTCRSAL